MALIFCDGFDWYATADLPLRWTDATNYGNTTFVGPAYARSPSGQGVLMGTGNSNARLIKSFSSNYTAGVIGFAVRTAGTWVSRTIVVLEDGSTEQCSVRTNASSVITVQQGSTVRATGSTVLAANTWYYIELKVTVHGSTGVAEVKLNGASEIASTSSLDLTGTANNYWNRVSFSPGNNGYSPWFDDIYVLDPTTGSNTDFLGPIMVVARYPDGNGNHSDWTPNGGTNMGCVSEPYEDGNTSFNQSSTANQIDTFTMQNLPAASGSVFSIAQHTVAAQDGGAARTIRSKFRISGTDYSGSNVATSSSYQFFTQYNDTSPATGSAWSVSEVDGLESGYELVS